MEWNGIHHSWPNPAPEREEETSACDKMENSEQAEGRLFKNAQASLLAQRFQYVNIYIYTHAAYKLVLVAVIVKFGC